MQDADAAEGAGHPERWQIWGGGVKGLMFKLKHPVDSCQCKCKPEQKGNKEK